MAVSDTVSRAEGLLEQIAETALDDDYYVVRSDSDGRSREFNTVLTGVVLAVFALLVALAAIQTRTDRPATERERATLISDIDARKTSLASRETTAQQLRTQVTDLSAKVDRFDPALEQLRIVAADTSVRGPGITVTVSPTVLGDAGANSGVADSDLRILVNGLWYAGAEAVAVNGRRIGSLTSIRYAAGVIKVNYAGIAAPYVVTAIGDKDALADRFTENPAGRYWAAKQADGEVTLDVTRSTNLSMDAVPAKRSVLRHATALEEDR